HELWALRQRNRIGESSGRSTRDKSARVDMLFRMRTFCSQTGRLFWWGGFFALGDAAHPHITLTSNSPNRMWE
ncbi:MAG: hypothetical protein WAN72_09690, partial [Candidatus Acidiferrales bacterium]